MTGKRKRGEGLQSNVEMIKTAFTNGKPLSAIAAARLRAEANLNGVVTLKEPIERALEPPIASAESPVPGFGYQESEAEEEAAIVKQNFKLCNWRNEAQNILSDTDFELTVRLNKHSTIALLGCFSFKVVRGAININGANIGVVSCNGQQDARYTAYAPATHAISKLRGLDSTNHIQVTSCKEPAPLSNISPLFAGIWNEQTGKTQRTFTMITESDTDVLDRPLSPETSPEDWLRTIEECASSPSVVSIVGPSTSGKSTFARRLLNRYLTGQGKSARPLQAVCYLDLDFTKPEYTPHGQICLVKVGSLKLGPNFTHPATVPLTQAMERNEVIRAHPIATDLANYKEYYRACAEDLFLAYKKLRSSDPSLPLIINTPGSLYTLDFDMLSSMLARFKPHHVVHLGDVQAIDTDIATRLHSLQTASSLFRGTIHEITAQFPVVTPMRTESELRAMHMQSYFHLKGMSNSKPNRLAWNANPMSHLIPWEFCYEETEEQTQDFVGFAMYSEPVEEPSLVHALNGSIVQIVESTSSVIPNPYSDLPRTTKHRIPHFPKSALTGMVEPLDPKTSKLVCTALVRGFDPKRKVVQVVVPKTHEALLYSLVPERTVFVGGCCEHPEWAYLEDAYATHDQAVTLSSEEHGTPWVEKRSLMEDMGYLNTVRRVRKFQT